MFTEIKHAIRALKNSPSVVIVVTLCLALGLGANTTIFALTNAVFLRPLPVQAPHKLVRIYSGWGGERFRSSSYPEYSALNERRDAFQGVAAYSRIRVSVGRGEETTMEHAILATGNFFQVVGLTPAAGRFFNIDEDRVAGEHMVAVISHQLWTQRFGGSNDVIGKSVYVNAQPFRIVGVAPANFFGMEPENESALWLPIMTYPVTTGRDQTQLQQGSHWLTLIGRLAPRVTIDQARQVANAVARTNSFGFENTATSSLQFTVLKGGTLANTEESAEIGIVFVILNVVVGLVLLIACANVANVLLARALDRRREVAIRLSLGAGRLRIVRQLLVEALLLGLLGGAAGLALAFWGARLLRGFRLPAGIDPTPDLRVFAYSFVVALATALLFGILPARQSARASVSDALKQGKRLGNPARSRLRSTLVVAQLSLSVLLLVMAGLLLRALQELQAAQTGVVEARMVSGELDLTTLGVDEEQGKLIFDHILEQVRALPDVEAASVSAMLPSGARQWRAGGVTLPEHQQFAREEIALTYNVVSPEYFKALGVPLLHGRDLTSGDRKGQPRAFVVNQAFVRRYWPGRDALGTRIQMSADEQGEIVGVVGDVRYESAGEAA